MLISPSESGLKPLNKSALEDIVSGAMKWHLWTRLGWLDIKRRYRRTAIGPFWSALALLIFVAVLGSVGSGLLSKQSQEYLPFLVAGMVVWVMLSNLINEAGSVFITGAGLIRQMNFEYSVVVLALVWRNLIVFFHNFTVYLALMLYYKPESLTPVVFLAIPALILLMLNGIWIGLLLGIITTRFRDVQQLIQSVVQVSMFVTPLFWPPDSLSGLRRIIFVTLNPLYHLLSIVRDPLLGQLPRPSSYVAVLIITVLGWTIAFTTYHVFRKRLAYWL
jgi:ABC-type polysaccharide/polyol phosphate export permease